jgi:hypothetical protein
VSWLSRMANVFRSSAVDRTLDEEMQFHIEARVDDLVAAGMTREAAELAASRQFGNRLRIRESSRDVKLLPWVESVFKDIRFLRMFRKHIVVTGAAIASLTLALGACLAAFSLIDALILWPLPVREPERLIYLTFPTYSAGSPIGSSFSYPLFSRLRDSARNDVELFAIEVSPTNCEPTSKLAMIWTSMFEARVPRGLRSETTLVGGVARTS